MIRYLMPAALLVLATACSQEPAVAPEAPAQPDQTADRGAAIAASTATINGDRIRAADSEPGNWLAHGRTYDEQRYSPLDTINAETIDKLGLAWAWDTGTTRGLEATPIVVDGVMFTSGAWSVV
ncbi:MAG: hypothetical protein ACO377_01050, partial [Pseudomonadales bacterium]